MSESNPSETPGKVTSGKVLFLRETRGTAKTEDDREYDMSVDVATGTPIIYSHQSKRYFVLGWKDIVNMAIARGIDEPE